MPRRILFAAALAVLAGGCDLFTDSGPDPLEVATLSLSSPTYPVLALKNWPDSATVAFTLRNAAGESLCGRVPLTVEVADSFIVAATYSPTAPDPCTVALRVSSPGSTWLRVRAGSKADSLELQVTPTRFVAELRPPAAKPAGVTVAWELEVRSEDGIAAPGAFVTFVFKTASALSGGTDLSTYETATAVSDAGGVARLQRALPTSTQYGIAQPSGSFGPGGAMRVEWSPPVGVGLEQAFDDQPIVPGAAVRLGVEVQRCASGPGPVSCSFRVPSPPVRLTNRSCPNGTAVTERLVAVAYDAWNNPVASAPAVAADAGSLAPVVLGQYLAVTGPGTRTWYEPSQVAYTSLADGVDSARVTVSYPGLASRTVDVVRDTTPCP